MRLSYLSLISTCCGLVVGFRDTSPFFAFSSSRIFDSVPQLSQGSHIALSSSLADVLTAISDECPSESYILIHQPGANAADFQSIDSSPHLRHQITGSDGAVQSSIMISDVIGHVNLDTVQQQLISKCHVQSTKLDVEVGAVGTRAALPQLIEIEFPELPVASAQRAAKVLERDAFLNAVMNNLNKASLTVVYTTSPSQRVERIANSRHEQQLFEYEETPFSQSLHTDLKRDLGQDKVLKRRANSNTTNNAGLFETYTYMNAGIFQGGIAAIILISILYVGISAVAGIEVSYAAFSKEMGPAAQKKQQSQQQQAQ